MACAAGEARRAAASWAGEGALTRESGPVRAEERRSGLPVGKGESGPGWVEFWFRDLGLAGFWVLPFLFLSHFYF